MGYIKTAIKVRIIAQGAIKVFEAVLAGALPKQHEMYVDGVVRAYERKIEDFKRRNERLVADVKLKAEQEPIRKEEIRERFEKNQPRGRGLSDLPDPMDDAWRTPSA
jgi:hypothetical protein